MDSELESLECTSENTLTCWSYFEHCKLFILKKWRLFLKYLFFSMLTLISVYEIFKLLPLPTEINNSLVLIIISTLSFGISFLRCVYSYCTSIPDGLENESSQVQRIVRRRKMFWEYDLFHRIVTNQISEIDVELDNILNNRVYVEITKNLDEPEYINWLQLRPINMIKLVDVAKRLFIHELGQSLSSTEDDEQYYMSTVKFSYLVSDLYKDLYDYEIAGRQISAPNDFALLHEIQSGWVESIRDVFKQVLETADSTAKRHHRDLSPLEGLFVFPEPPRIDEFNHELDRLKLSK